MVTLSVILWQVAEVFRAVGPVIVAVSVIMGLTVRLVEQLKRRTR